MTLEAQLEIIKKVPQEEKDKAQNRWNAIAKPLGSLGKLEDLVILRVIYRTGKKKKGLLLYLQEITEWWKKG